MEELEVWKPLLLNMTEWSATQSKKIEINKVDLESLIPKLPEEDSGIEELLPQIALIEAEIKKFGQLETQVKNERLAFTRQVDEKVKKNLMIFEKSLEKQKEDLKQELLPLKVIEARWRKKLQDRLDEIADFRRKISEDCLNQIERASIKIHEKVTELYKNALEDDSVEMTGDEYLEAYINTFSEDDFVCSIPEKGEDKEKNKLIDLIYSGFNPSDLLNKFQTELESAFSSFESDKKEKAEAMIIREAVQKAAIREEVKEAETNRHFSSSYVAPSPVLAKTSNLKYEKVLDMHRGKTTMLEVMKAFAKNLDQAESYYGGKDYFDIVEPMVAVLEKMANAGRQFETLKFKESPKGF